MDCKTTTRIYGPGCCRCASLTVSMIMFILLCVLWGEVPITHCNVVWFDANLNDQAEAYPLFLAFCPF